MNMFFRRAFDEYRRQSDLKKSFAAETRKLSSILKTNAETSGGELIDRADFEGRSPLLLLMPLVEIAWADGRVSRGELDAIVQAAEVYGLTADEENYRAPVERMLIARPVPNEVGRMWQDFQYLMEKLPQKDRETLTCALFVQAQFVAEQSTDRIIGFLRGERICQNEQETLRLVAEQIEKAKAAAEEADAQKYVAAQLEKESYYQATESFSDEDKSFEKAETIAAEFDDDDRLIPLIPLVKVAWAEGRITRRERELIFETAERKGIAAGSRSHERLAGWLELHPTDDFYLESLERLNHGWRDLSADEKNLRRLDVLSDCVNIAEASGGTTRYAAGGRRVCDEEFAAVKRIAHKLNAPPTKSPDALISLAA